MSTTETLTAWFRGRIPDGWFTEPVTVAVDRDEVVVTGVLPTPDLVLDAGDILHVSATLAGIEALRERAAPLGGPR